MNCKQPLLEINNVTLQAGNERVCSNLSIRIQRGEIWGVLGPNGCGKTTLLQTLAGLLTQASGEIYLEGVNLLSLSRKKIAQKLGILFQDTQDIFPQTVWEVCYSGRHPHGYSKQDETITKQALREMDLDAQSTQWAHTLSGGERKRLSLAALLTQTPCIYLLDEPTNHLDLHYQVNVLNHFKHLVQNQSASIVMSLHDINLAAHYCQKILLLFGKGKYLAGDTASLLNNHYLSLLYQHPIKQMGENHSGGWQAVFDVEGK
jgi:iron complex transport system ATP-binding protein